MWVDSLPNLKFTMGSSPKVGLCVNKHLKKPVSFQGSAIAPDVT